MVNMKSWIVSIIVLAMLATVSAEYSFVIVSSTEDSVIFESDCITYRQCVDGGNEYCGVGEAKNFKCNTIDEVCEIVCNPIRSHSIKEDIPASISVQPVDKIYEMPLRIYITEKSGSDPIICDIDIYYGGIWVNEQYTGATHWGGSMAVLSTFSGSNYYNGTLLEKTHTDRQGFLEFTPQKPGMYVFKLLNRYVTVLVGDENGNVYNCSNSVCETALGEDETSCPQDCVVEEVEEGSSQGGVTSPVSPPETCGDGICASPFETAMTCPSDCVQQSVCKVEGDYAGPGVACCEGLATVGVFSISPNGECVITTLPGGTCANCGNGICGASEDRCNCPQDCVVSQPAQAASVGGLDVTLIVVIVVLIAAVVIVLMTVKSGKLKVGTAKPAQQPVQQALPLKCPKCGTDPVPGCAYCTNCGSRI